MLPLIQAGSSLQPSLLANWSQYGIALEAATGVTSSSSPLLVPCLQYKVKSSMELSVGSQQVLHLFVLLEHVPVGIVEEDRWAHLMGMTAALRNNLVSLASIHSGKFCEAVHSALNKLLCNYASHAAVSMCGLAMLCS